LELQNLHSFFCGDLLHSTNGKISWKMRTTWGCPSGTMLTSLRQLLLLHPLWSVEKQTWGRSSLDLDAQGSCSMCRKLSGVMQSCGPKINLNKVDLTLNICQKMSIRYYQTSHVWEECISSMSKIDCNRLKLHLGGTTTGGLWHWAL
jgi:hypothetical protein